VAVIRHAPENAWRFNAHHGLKMRRIEPSGRDFITRGATRLIAPALCRFPASGLAASSAVLAELQDHGSS
jgi:hypothetical protein